ncbi:MULTISPECIES: aldehyde dehydrogenase [Burkholderia]|uniref:aldehyde dehydrogenase n=1 Tax=Burkholderia TaxID=32008 RepID=UPI001CF12567|nr:aldehyde dehydrogenase [Burkholderia cepacia]MCA8054437.1 aldehyde dehydrogenase [Burkholderia cepacia]MCA8131326.1 aldehyde dehydrogenase [Burkholderia cepacia]HEM7892057.1 aldehyde dehydrogenase [Burkholderia cepacia]HEM8512983.1 aldehyde dehydrogenase [Burkholderia cepacia]
MTPFDTSLVPDGNILIGGEWRRGRGAPYASIYPADQSLNMEVSTANAEDAAEAVVAADAAWRRADWAGLKPHLRAQVLYRIADLIMQRHEALANLQRRDNGKPIGETRVLVASAANTFRYFAACLETLDEELTPSRGDYLTMSVHEPIGVIAAITPWNSPIASDAQKLAPALAGGNAVVLKPAEVTPLVSLALARICEEAGVPKGVLSVLPGKGSVIGDVLVRHPLVKKVSFTGGTEVGRGIARIAAEKLMPVSLELGGKSPTIVCDDADLDHAVNGVLYGIFSSSGEACIAGSRLFVQRAVYDEFMKRLVAGARKLRVGDPTRPDTQMGPLITAKHRESVERYVALGLEEGGRLLCGGERPSGDGRENGFFYQPTILDGLPNSARICQEEIFGPVLVAMPFDDEASLIAQANDSVFGLAAGIWTRDYKRAWRIARALETGTVWINTYKLFSISTPFSGWKESGMGREKGRLGIREYMQQKSLYWGLNDAPLPWAN